MQSLGVTLVCVVLLALGPRGTVAPIPPPQPTALGRLLPNKIREKVTGCEAIGGGASKHARKLWKTVDEPLKYFGYVSIVQFLPKRGRALPKTIRVSTFLEGPVDRRSRPSRENMSPGE